MTKMREILKRVCVCTKCGYIAIVDINEGCP